jgi:hypothetical protein
LEMIWRGNGEVVEKEWRSGGEDMEI